MKLHSYYTKQEVIRYLLLAIAVAVTQKVLWHISGNFQLVPNLVSWFLPAGFRLFVYLATPIRSWPFLYVILTLANSLFIIQGGEQDQPALYTETPWLYLFFLLTGPVIIMSVVWFYRRHYVSPFINTVSGTIVLFIIILTLALSNALKLLIRKWIESSEKAEEFIGVMSDFVLGDIVGMFALTPILLVIYQLCKSNNNVAFSDAFKVAMGWLILLLGFTLVLGFDHDLDYYMKVMTIIPVVYFSYRFGWIGAGISVFALCIQTYLSAYFHAGPTLENQFYIISISICGLILGAAISQMKGLNAEIVNTNLNLSSAVNDIRTLSSRMIKLQEDERKSLSRDLHDDFGHRIVDIKLNLAIAAQSRQSDDKLQLLEDKLDGLYKAMKSSIGKLRPVGLEHQNLDELLISSEMVSSLKASNISFSHLVSSKLPELSDSMKLTIYRIFQEAINNVIKHSEANNVTLLITSTDRALEISIKDNGIGFSNETGINSYGLMSMKERASSIGAKLIINSNTSGTTIDLIVPVQIVKSESDGYC